MVVSSPTEIQKKISSFEGRILKTYKSIFKEKVLIFYN